MANAEVPPSKVARVLIVDDEPPNLRTFKRIFGKTFEVLTAESKAEALKLLETQTVDVVVTDFAMPAGNGVELARELKSKYPEIQVVMLTGFPDLPEVMKAHRERLIASVIAKPWERDDILTALNQLLRLQEMRKHVAELTGSKPGK